MTYRNFFLLLLIAIAPFARAQQPWSVKRYPAISHSGTAPTYDWSAIDALEADGLPRKAIEQILQLQQRAITEKNVAEYWKTLDRLAQNYEDGMFEPEEVQTYYRSVHNQAEALPFPLSNVAHYYLSQWLNNAYFENPTEQTGWKIGNQTIIPNQQHKSALVTYHERASLNHPEELMEWSTGLCFYKPKKAANEWSYDEVVYTSNLNDYPTLFDFMAKEYLASHEDYFGGRYSWRKERDVTDTRSFAGTDSLRFSADYLNDTTLIFPLYYTLERLHLEQKRYDLFTRWQLERINMVANGYDENQKQSLQLNALLRLENELYALNQASACLPAYRRAALLHGTTESYHWKNNTAPADNNKLALEVIRKALARFPDNKGNSELKELEAKILSQELNFTLKTQVIPGQSFLLGVNYRNTSSAIMKIYHVNQFKNVTDQNQLHDLDLTEIYHHNPSFATDDKYLPQDKDFLIPALPSTGYFLVVLAENEQALTKMFAADTLSKVHGFAYKMIHNSDLTARTKDIGSGYQLQVLHTLTGKPISGASVVYSRQVYNYGEPKNMIMSRAKTDKNGLSLSDYTNEYVYTVIAGNDSISSNMYHYRYDYSEKELTTKVQIFTDRSIYRPGQTVHYKVIAYSLNEQTHKVIPDFQVRLNATDYNDQKLASETLRTDAFGTATGSFVLPMDGFLLGNIRLTVNESVSETTIRVEEYKRPTFEVTFDTIRTQFALGDTVTLSGTVNAFAGYPIGGAKVEVSVNEHRYFPWDYRGSYNTDDELHLTLVSGPDGRFTVQFPTSKKDKVQWGASYSIEAVATDLTGETQQSNTDLYIGQEPVSIDAYIPGQVFSPENISPVVTVNNNYGVEQKGTRITWKLTKRSEGTLLNSTVEQAHYQDFTREQLKKALASVAYFGEDQNETYTQVGEGMLTSGDSIELNKLVQHLSGFYRITFSVTQADGSESHNEYNFNWIDPKAKKQAESFLWTYTAVHTVKPGSSVPVLLGSSLPEQQLFAEYYCGTKLYKTEWIRLKGRGQLKISIPKDATHTIYVQLASQINGRHHQQTVVLPIENLERTLEVKLLTQRDYLQPGKKEEWSVSVRDQRHQPADAELMVNMYDASLDQFETHGWNSYLLTEPYLMPNWFVNSERGNNYDYGKWNKGNFIIYSEGGFFGSDLLRTRQTGLYSPKMQAFGFTGAVTDTYSFGVDANSVDGLTAGTYSLSEKDMAEEAPAVKVPEQASQIRVRENFAETAFFYPQLHPQADGTYHFTFTTPDALTRWRFMALAHAKDLRMGYEEHFISTRKEIMIMPNVPRYFREGDEVVFSAKVSNQTSSTQQTTSKLRILDPITEKDITAQFGDLQPVISQVPANGTTQVSWTLRIPVGAQTLVAYHIETSTATFGDAEKRAVPILSNRILLTASKPFTTDKAGTETFTLEAVKNLPANAEKLQLKIDIQTQPLWTTLMSLPYLMEYPHECAEQTFARYFANTLAQKIIADNPEIRKVIETWKNTDRDAFLSQLEKNPELKAIILSETPWVLDARNEKNQHARMAALFDENQLEQSIQSALTKLHELRAADGGWSWFGNESSNLYITQYIVSGFGKLKSLGVEVDDEMINAALTHLDAWYTKQYASLKTEDKKRKAGFSEMTAHWLITRTYFRRDTTAATNYYTSCMEANWKQFGLQTQAMIGILCHSNGNKALANKIRASILDKATVKPQLGMYWNENHYGYYWYDSQLETQSALIELIHVTQPTGKLPVEMQQMQLWLMQHKRSNAWETTRSTTLACYALLIDKSTVNSQIAQKVTVRSNGKALGSVPNATGFTEIWTGNAILPGQEDVTITTTTESPVFGAIHLMYLADQQSVQAVNSGDLKVERTIYRIENGKKVVVQPNEVLPAGTRLSVELRLTGNRPMEFVHIHAPHAYGFEPVNPLSGYRYNNGSYYEVNKDASVEFFADQLIKGTTVFTYDVFVTGKGTLSLGPAVAECMYAPEFRANTAGATVKVN